MLLSSAPESKASYQRSHSQSKYRQSVESNKTSVDDDVSSVVDKFMRRLNELRSPGYRSSTLLLLLSTVGVGESGA